MGIFQQFIDGMRETALHEVIAVIFGIASVWYSRKESILTYPVGLVNTILYIYLSVKAQLFGEAAVNLYYTIVSIYGWILWAKKDKQQHHVVLITTSNRREWVLHLLFFSAFYVVIYFCLSYLEKNFWPNAIPWADAFASASAFTGMWLMAKKKVESWYWWMVTNVASIPLYFVKGYMLTSLYYLILLLIAFWGLAEWMRKAKQHRIPDISPVLSAQKTAIESNT